MELVVIVIMLALVEYFVLGARVGLARGRTGLEAPAVTGNEEFERYFRVHYNTIEQLILFVPRDLVFCSICPCSWCCGGRPGFYCRPGNLCG